MLTVMCPNCRHRFPAPGCCNPGPQGPPPPPSSSDNHHHHHHHHHHNDNHQRDEREMIVNGSDRSINGAFYSGGYLLVPREHEINNPRGCFINAPTIIHGPTIIQQQSHFEKNTDSFINDRSNLPKSTNSIQQANITNYDDISNRQMYENGKTKIYPQCNDHNCQINTTCDLTGGTVTITTPGIQSGGCLIHSTDSGILVQSPRIEIRPKLSGGGCFVQKGFSIDDDEQARFVYPENEKNRYTVNDNFDGICLQPPSGCQELPGTRRFVSSIKDNQNHHHHHQQQQQQQQQKCLDSVTTTKNNDFNVHHNVVSNTENSCCSNSIKQSHTRHNESEEIFRNATSSMTHVSHSSCCCGTKIRNDKRERDNRYDDKLNRQSSMNESNDITKKSLQTDSSNGMEIRVNATLQLPPNVGHCTVNITATAGNTDNTESRIGQNGGRTRDNFNGGGLINFDGNTSEIPDRNDEAPTTPLSWLMPCPWGFENYNYPMDRDVTRLAEIKRLLQTSGWYHEGLSWQQSETILKNTPVGRWLVRDSSDSRFIFAVSVQTTRGPTSVRVHYFCGKFRLDAEPRLSLAMPMFDCPIKMLEHYVDYSKRIDEHRKEVWVDYSGQLYSQIYLTKPLVKDVQSLSHLARCVVNSNKFSVEHLPPLMKNYLAEYPYSL